MIVKPKEDAEDQGPRAMDKDKDQGHGQVVSFFNQSLKDVETEFSNLFQDTTMDHFGRENVDQENMGYLFADDPSDFVTLDDLANDPILGHGTVNVSVETVLGNEKSEKKILTPFVALSAASQSTISPPAKSTTPPFVPMSLSSLLLPHRWKQQPPTTPFVPLVGGAFQTSPAPLAPGIFSPPMPQMIAAAPPVLLRPLVPHQHQNLTPKHAFTRFHVTTDQEEEQKKEKKRLAVRKCRDKKRKEIKELETRASRFDHEMKQLQHELKRARTEGKLVENPAGEKDLEQVRALLAALCNQDAAELSAISSRLLSVNCTATSPGSSAEACGREAVLAHFKHLASCFSVADVDICTESVCSEDQVIRCKWSLRVRQIATAFGIIVNAHGAIPMALDGSCRFSFCGGVVVDIICSWNHSALVLHLLGIPSTFNECA